MRRLSLLAFASFLALWVSYSFFRDDLILYQEKSNKIKRHSSLKDDPQSSLHNDDNIFSPGKRRDLEKIGQVINEENVALDQDERMQIKKEKSNFDNNFNLKEKLGLLEQSFMDQASTLQDTKRLQDEIVKLKNKMKIEIKNTEKWDAPFIYYLMIQENYTYQEINEIKSLHENGLSSEEIAYINELVKEKTFKEKIQAFKSQGENGRIIASLKNPPKEKDELIQDNDYIKTSAESKMIEMNYIQDDKEENLYGNNQ